MSSIGEHFFSELDDCFFTTRSVVEDFLTEIETVLREVDEDKYDSSEAYHYVVDAFETLKRSLKVIC